MPIVVAVLPAFVFLGVLLLMDSFKLVRPASVGLALVYGVVAGIACEALHLRLLAASVDVGVLTRLHRAGHRGGCEGAVRRLPDSAAARRIRR